MDTSDPGLPAETIPEFGSQVPMKRAGQPAEIAPSYVFLASEDASYMTGQILHPTAATSSTASLA